MTDVITPFYRLSESERDSAGFPWVVRLMRLHFVLAGLVLLLSALALIVYLYTRVFEGIDLSWTLRLAHTDKAYEVSTQFQIITVLGLLLASLIELRAVNRLRQRTPYSLWLARLAAALLLAGFPAAVFLWQMEPDLPGIPVNAARLALRVISVVMVVQAVLALWYSLSLLVPAVRRRLVTRDAGVQNPFRRVQIAGLVLWSLLLVGLGVTLAVLTDWIELPVSTPAPGELLYATTFDAFGDEWSIYGGRDSAQIVQAGDLALVASDTDPVTGGMLVVSYGSPTLNESVFSVLDRKFNDIDLRVTARQVSGPVDNQYGVLFRYRDLDNYYGFLISSNGYYALVKDKDGVLEFVSNWGLSDVIRQGEAANEIRVVARGDGFRFFVNGQPMPLCLRGQNLMSMWDESQGPGVCFEGGEMTYVYRDDDFKQGRVALAAGSSVDLSSEIVIGFDDLVIIGPEPDALTVGLDSE